MTIHVTVTDDYPDGPASWCPIQGPRVKLGLGVHYWPNGRASRPGDVRDWPVHLIAGDMDRLLKKVHWPHGIRHRHMPGDFFIGSFSSFCAKSRRPGCSVHEAHREEGTLERKKKLWSSLCSRKHR